MSNYYDIVQLNKDLVGHTGLKISTKTLDLLIRNGPTNTYISRKPKSSLAEVYHRLEKENILSEKQLLPVAAFVYNQEVNSSGDYTNREYQMERRKDKDFGYICTKWKSCDTKHYLQYALKPATIKKWSTALHFIDKFHQAGSVNIELAKIDRSWINWFYDTLNTPDNMDEKIARNTVYKLYREMGYVQPKVVICDSFPTEKLEDVSTFPMKKILNDIYTAVTQSLAYEDFDDEWTKLITVSSISVDRNFVKDYIRENVCIFKDMFNWTASNSIAKLATLNRLANYTGMHPFVKLCNTLLEQTPFYIFEKDVAYVIRKPVEIHTLPKPPRINPTTGGYQNFARQRASVTLHNEDGPAVRWRDGTKQYWIRGIEVPYQIFENNECSSDYILGLRNVEVRRVVLEKIGIEKFVNGANMILEHQDEFGKLYIYESDDVIRKFIRVQNSTVSPDGNRKEFLLEVDPRITTAHEAVASTFGMTKEEYNPNLEA